MSERNFSVLGIALSLLSVGAQALFPSLWLVWVLAWTAGFFLLCWVALSEEIIGRWSRRYRGWIAMLVSVVMFIVAFRQARAQSSPPDVQFTLVYPKSAAVLIVNPTDRIVRDARYALVVWNLDKPDQINPFPIPTSTASGDFIQPHAGWGPNQTFEMPTVMPLLKKGDHLFGYATATCPNCLAHEYWVYVEYGTGGWYAELPADQHINLPELFKKIKDIATN